MTIVRDNYLPNQEIDGLEKWIDWHVFVQESRVCDVQELKQMDIYCGGFMTS